MWCDMTDTLLTNTDLERQLEAARQKVRRARAVEARLKRELLVTDRRRAAQQKICLGAALLLAAEAHPQHVASLRRLLLPLVTRETDRQALRDTIFSPDGEEASASASVSADDGREA